MAKNLRSKIAESDSLIIHDVNEKALQQFKEEVDGNVTVAKTVREVAENAVGVLDYMQTHYFPILFMMTMISLKCL